MRDQKYCYSSEMEWKHRTAFPTAEKTEYAVRLVKYTLHCNTLPRAYQAKVG